MIQGKVLVTGATGFIGRHVLPRLIARGYRVHAVGRTPIAGPLDVQWHNADLLAPGVAAALAATIRPSHLLHLAWTATSGEFWTAPENVDWVAASLALYRSFAIADGRRALFVGTCAADAACLSDFDLRSRNAIMDTGCNPCWPVDPASGRPCVCSTISAASPTRTGGGDQSPIRTGNLSSSARSEKRVTDASNCSWTVSVGPWRCLAMMISAFFSLRFI